MHWEDEFSRKRLVVAADVPLEDSTWKAVAKQSLVEREWRETTKHYSGDPARAVAYIPLARTLLGGLINQLRLGGISVGQRFLNLPNGTVIQAIVIGSVYKILISTQTVVGVDVKAGSFFGFVFYPKRNLEKVYIGFDPHAVMQALCDKDTPKLRVFAPEYKEYGNQFVFYGNDVYSWEQSERGDCSSDSPGLPVIYKNGKRWNSIEYGILGILPVTVEITDSNGNKVKDFRFLITTTDISRREVRMDQTALRCYKEVDGWLKEQGSGVQLIAGRSDEFIKAWWPCRFKQNGLEASMLFSYKSVIDVLNPNGSGVSLGEYDIIVYKSITATITHTEFGISAIVVENDEGFSRDWVVIKSTYEFDIEGVRNPGFYLNGYYNSSIAKLHATHNDYKYYKHTIAINYTRHGDINKLYLKYRTCGDSTDSRSVSFVSSDDGFTTSRSYKANTVSSIDREFDVSYFTDYGYKKEYFFSESDVFNYNWVDLGNSYKNNKYPIEPPNFSNFSLNANYAGTFNYGYVGIVMVYANLVDNVILTQFGNERYSKVYTGRREKKHNTVEFVDVVNTDNTTETGERISQGLYGCDLFLASKHGFDGVDFSTDKYHYTITPLDNLSIIVSDIVQHPREYGKSETFEVIEIANTFNLSTTTNLNRVIFSYGADDRVKCGPLAWAYSLYVKLAEGNPEVEPHFSAESTYGPLAKILPAIDSKGKQTTDTLDFPDLTVHPIGFC